MSRKRVLLYACLALAVPLPALALDTGSGPTSLDVQASLDACGIGDDGIVCTLNASFNRLEDAEYYTASVTAPDGTVSDLGTVAEGGGDGRASAALPVGFAGNGGYTVTVSAWGYDEEGRPDRIGSDESGAEGDGKPKQSDEPQPMAPGPDPAPSQPEVDPPPVEPPPPVEQPGPLEPAPETPECPQADSAAPPDKPESTTTPSTTTPDPCAERPPETEQAPKPAPPPD